MHSSGAYDHHRAAFWRPSDRACNTLRRTSRELGCCNMRRLITVNDRMQRDYRYELVEPVGRNFDPEFKPDLTPAEMLCLGVFGGKYMIPIAAMSSRRAGSSMPGLRADRATTYSTTSVSKPVSRSRNGAASQKTKPPFEQQLFCHGRTDRPKARLPASSSSDGKCTVAAKSICIKPD